LPLVITNTSVIPMIGPTSSTMVSAPLFAAAARAARMLRLRASSVGFLLGLSFPGETGGRRPVEDTKRRRVVVPTPNLPNRHHLRLSLPAPSSARDPPRPVSGAVQPPLGDDPHRSGRHEPVQRPAPGGAGP